MEPKAFERLLELIQQTVWTKSKTYKPHYEHEYVIYKDHPELCDLLRKAIAENGYDRTFHGQPHRYIDLDAKRYWHYQVVYNRDRADKVLPE